MEDDMSKTAPVRILLGWLALVWTVAAGAAESTATFVVQAQISAACEVSSSILDFGPLGVLSGNIDATTTLVAVCTNSTPYDIGLDAGSAVGSTVDNRLLANGAATLSYQLYSDSTHNQIWGEIGR